MKQKVLDHTVFSVLSPFFAFLIVADRGKLKYLSQGLI